MKNKAIFLFALLLSVMGMQASASPAEKFWDWFKKNSDEIFYFEDNREVVFDKLSTALSKVDNELTFEFSPVKDNGKREFVISAGGIKSSFSSVETLIDNAPTLKKWELVKYRQRHIPLNDITFNGLTVKAKDVYYNLYKDEDKLGVMLFFDNYSKEEHIKYANIGFLFLDSSLGEFDVATKLGFIEFQNKKSEYFEGASSISELSKQVDEYYAQK